jgi:hypothetical protein
MVVLKNKYLFHAKISHYYIEKPKTIVLTLIEFLVSLRFGKSRKKYYKCKLYVIIF